MGFKVDFIKNLFKCFDSFFVSFMNSPFIMSCVDVPLKYGNALSALATPALTVRNAYCVRMKWYSTGMARNATE